MPQWGIALAWIAWAASLFNDWPWLAVTFSLLWLSSWGRWPARPWLFGLELMVVVVTEVVLGRKTPPRPVARSYHRVIMESMSLLWLAFLFGAIGGLVAWEGTVGFDAGSRARGFVSGLLKRTTLRGIRFVLGLILLVVTPLWFR